MQNVGLPFTKERKKERRKKERKDRPSFFVKFTKERKKERKKKEKKRKKERTDHLFSLNFHMILKEQIGKGYQVSSQGALEIIFKFPQFTRMTCLFEHNNHIILVYVVHGIE